jgi:hypothetical protein
VPEDSDPGESPPAEARADRPPSTVVDDAPSVTCTRCDGEWDLTYELDELALGNQAPEQFALDHKRHTGHFPDGVTTWRAICRHCPEGSEHLAERGARRWADTHARHTRHAVEIRHGESELQVIGGDEPDGKDGPDEPDA